MNGSLVQCLNVRKCFGDVSAVDNVNFDLEPGEILSILGPSGCGKTTLLRLIAGFESIDGGEIKINNRLVSGRTVHLPPEGRNIGMVFQEYALFPHMTVAQNVTFGLIGLPGPERLRRLLQVTELVRLTGLEERYPHELSGGQQQRVALARTLAPRPVTVLLDEPFSNLDTSMRSEMRQEVEAILRENGIATVFVTHDREEAFAMADRIGVMNNGHLDQLDAPDVIYNSPENSFVARMAGMCDFLSGEARGGRVITEIGSLPCLSSGGPLPDGAQVDLLVHPEDFQVVPDSLGMAIVRSREFRGDETILSVGVPSGAVLRCRQRFQSNLTSGTRVKLVPAKALSFLVFRKVSDED